MTPGDGNARSNPAESISEPMKILSTLFLLAASGAAAQTGSLNGVAIDANGNPIAGAIVDLFRETPPLREDHVRTLGNGDFHHDNLMPGRYTAQLMVRGNAMGPRRTLTVLEGRNTELRFDFTSHPARPAGPRNLCPPWGRGNCPVNLPEVWWGLEGHKANRRLETDPQTNTFAADAGGADGQGAVINIRLAPGERLTPDLHLRVTGRFFPRDPRAPVGPMTQLSCTSSAIGARCVIDPRDAEFRGHVFLSTE